MHQVESMVDPFKRHRMCNKIINLNFTCHIFLNIAWQFCSPFDATECASLPNTSCYKLERTCCNFSSCWCYTDDGGNTPTFMTAFQSLSHEIHTAYAFEGIIHTTIRHIDENLCD